MSAHILVGDCRARLRELEPGSVQTCVTSPPYWGLRDYGVEGQLGLEESPDAFVANLVEVFREVRRVLRDDGTLWLNLGDSYAGSPGGMQGKNGERCSRTFTARIDLEKKAAGLKTKDLVGIPWMVAFALRADGWYLRSEVIWHKPNPMPESVKDRPTKSHEQIFLLSKRETYFYDEDAIRTPLSPKTHTTYGSERRSKGTDGLGRVMSDNLSRDIPVRKPKVNAAGETMGASRRDVWVVDEDEYMQFLAWKAEREGVKTDVWKVATHPFKEAHFATFPPELIEPCILAGSRVGDGVLDPFSGAGTTGLVALKHGRSYMGIELNPAYAAMADRRIREDQTLLNRVLVG